MGDDVARPQPGQRGADVGAFGDVGHERRPGQLGGLERGVERRRHVRAAGARSRGGP